MYYFNQPVGSIVPFYWYVTTEDPLCDTQLQWSILTNNPYSGMFTISNVGGFHLENTQVIDYATLSSKSFTLG